VNGTLTIAKAPLTVTADNQSQTYNGSTFTGFTAHYSGFVDGDKASVVGGAPSFSGTAVTAIDAGSYPITPGPGSLSAANYDFTTFVNGTLTIARAPLTVIADNQSQTYNGSTFTGFTAHYSGFVQGDTQAVISGAPSFSGAAVTAVDVGSYSIIPGPGGLSAANYDFTTFVNSTLTIAKAHLTVIADDQSPTYNGSSFTNFTVHYSGLVNGETAGVISGAPSFSGAAVTAINAGSYSITPGPGTLSAANYDFTTFENGTLTIAKAPLTIIADDQSQTYDGSVFSGFTAHYRGFVNGDTASVVSGVPSFSGAAVTAVNPGTYPITPGPGSLSAINYDFTTFASGTLTLALPPPVTMTKVVLATNKKHQVTQIILSFSGALNAVLAQELGLYRLATAGKRGSFTARNAKVIPLTSAAYNAANDTVTLVTRKPLSLARVVQLQVNGQPPSGLEDSLGRLIDGDRNGQPGSNAVALLRRGGVTISAVT
jgi:predicted GNAT superfamily acetyltransferase